MYIPVMESNFCEVVRLHTSYVPSDTIHKFIAVDTSSLVISGFQSSRDESKSSANLKHKPMKRPLLTNDPELHADILVDSNVTTTAEHDSKSVKIERFKPHVVLKPSKL